MMTKSKAIKIYDRLLEQYPEAACSLAERKDPFRLLISAILSAQCTDRRVNMIVGPLFDAYPKPMMMASANLSDVEKLIRSCGLYRTKARSIIGSSKILCEKHGGHLPRTREELMAFPGVGRKVANLVLGEIYRIPSVVVDTHCARVAIRLGISTEKTPEKIERDLMHLLDQRHWIMIGHLLVFHGRRVCEARTPHCDMCVLKKECRYGQKIDPKHAGT